MLVGALVAFQTFSFGVVPADGEGGFVALSLLFCSVAFFLSPAYAALVTPGAGSCRFPNFSKRLRNGLAHRTLSRAL